MAEAMPERASFKTTRFLNDLATNDLIYLSIPLLDYGFFF